MPSDFPDDVKQFINEHVESLAQLEVLLLIRAAADRAWTAQAIAGKLSIMPEMSATLLGDLVRRGFATKDQQRFQYRSSGEVTDRLIDCLARLYVERRVAVTTEIYSKPLNKVKTFADAFRFRKEN
jgi:hypothetical protein